MIVADSDLVSGLVLHRYPALHIHSDSTNGNQGPFVLLHGWGGDSRTWQPILAHLQELGEVIAIDLPGFGGSEVVPEFDLDSVLALLEQHIPAQATLIGWSLGGMLAVALAARAPRKIMRVITFAANVKFVAEGDYKTAMPPAINKQFNQDFATDAERTLKLFCGLLAQGDDHERALLKSLRAASLELQPNHNWQEALTLLSQLDNRAAFAQMTQPGLHLYGEADALVPVAVAKTLHAFNQLQQVEILTGAAHALHWSHPEKVMQLVRTFLQPALLDKRKVAQSFSRAAPTYDSVAGLQRDVGMQLLKKLALVPSSARILDVGCGTGFFSDYIKRSFPATELVALDIAEGMLHFARNQRDQFIHWLCGDAENLPLQTASIDLIFSSLALQWCDDLPTLFAELHRVLKPGGRLLFTTLGPGTLYELKSAWQAVDGYVHVNRFQSAERIQAVLQGAGFDIEGWQTENRVLRYERLVELTRELKALGAHNVNHGQPSGLTGRRKLEMFRNAYEKFRCEDYLPATYEVFYGVARNE